MPWHREPSSARSRPAAFDGTCPSQSRSRCWRGSPLIGDIRDRGSDVRCFETAHCGASRRATRSESAASSFPVSEDAKRFYLGLGFSESLIEPLTLMVTLGDLQASL